MFDISIWKFFLPGIVLLSLVFIFLARDFGVIKLKYLNLKWLRELEAFKSSTDDPAYNNALAVIISYCQGLNSKWLLEKSDLDILENTYQLVKRIACSYHPDSQHPLEKARICLVLNASIELKNQLLKITTWKGIHTVTQFRIRHVISFSNAWELKKSWQKSKALIFLEKNRLLTFFKWPFFIFRGLDLTFWATKMLVHIIQDIVFKVFLIRWYLLIGKLAVQVFSDREKDRDIQPEVILDGLNSMPEYKNLNQKHLPEKIKQISEFSRNEILYHAWGVKWIEVKQIYITLIESIAREYHPKAKQPIYEATLFDLLISGVQFFEQIAAIKTFPFLEKFLELRVTHALMAKDTFNFLMNNQVLAWVRKYKLTHIFKYSSLLFKVVRKKHPALLFKDFAFTLASEGCKRWFYLYLNDRIALEANILYLRSRTTPNKSS